jgi:hypothetical protein
MGRGNYRLANTVGQTAFYGGIVLDAILDDSRELSIQWATAPLARWKNAVEAGIQFAWEHVHPRDIAFQGCMVTVQEIRTESTNSSTTIMIYVAAHALWDALSVQPYASPVFDFSTGLFTFPK